ncbi:hypothetical protein DPMN_059897 [Dreissena polymorpha]|uniref:Uncharacterized protein n=1 Tax=Dreissena polymorpha TaxID=45954 RepID=A0A9D4C4Y8_DREPO|nr:hypothetical protein DPMN_059897 [Dreissena polymorpha]
MKKKIDSSALSSVRALKFYLGRVKSIRGSCKRLFFPLKGKQCVCGFYFSSGSLDYKRSLCKIIPHELRALLASWAHINHTPLSGVPQAAF